MDSNDDFVVTWEGDLQSTSWGVFGDYFTVTAATAAIASATETGTTVTITTSTNGGFAVGNTVMISGVATPGYNGTFTITSVSWKHVHLQQRHYSPAGFGRRHGVAAAALELKRQFALTSTPISRGSFTPGLINSVTDLSNTGPRVAMFPTTAGTAAPFVVTWASYLSSNNNYNIFAETFNPKGSALTAAFQVNEAPVQPSSPPSRLPPSAGN